MRVHVFAKNVTLTPSLPEFIKRRLGFALSGFASRVINVVVRLHDLNGPRGGIDQLCRIDASVAPSTRKTVEGKGASMEAAICQAVDRIAGAVRKDLARRRTRRVRAGRRVKGPALRKGPANKQVEFGYASIRGHHEIEVYHASRSSSAPYAHARQVSPRC